MLSTLEKMLFLRSVTLFDHIADEGLTWIAAVCQEVYFTPGEQFITQGEPGDCLYVTVDGLIDVLVEGTGKIAIRSERDVIGDMSIISSSPRMAHCIAATDVTALKIDREEFLQLLRERPELGLGIIQVLVHRLAEASRKTSGTAEEAHIF